MESSRIGGSKYLIVIPAYNEEDSIEDIVRACLKYAHVCVVNDCSTDATPQILDRLIAPATESSKTLHVITHERNTHIPGAVVDGMRYARQMGYEYVITMDAGFSHDPEELPLFMTKDPADIVIGIRVKKVNTPLSRKLLSFFGNLAYNASLDFPRSLFMKRYYRDITSGYRRYSSKAVEVILSESLKSKSFDFLLESTALCYRRGLSISETYVSYHFSNSSLNKNVVMNCLYMCARLILRV
jgi:dolichol-phosphate mannosyltransferase